MSNNEVHRINQFTLGTFESEQLSYYRSKMAHLWLLQS